MSFYLTKYFFLWPTKAKNIQPFQEEFMLSGTSSNDFPTQISHKDQLVLTVSELRFIHRYTINNR